MTPHFPIYMDYGATTPVDPRVVDAMIPWLREHFGNPASRRRWRRRAAKWRR
jgi:cysteine desulfurase